jgi:hypothetical protein
MKRALGLFLIAVGAVMLLVGGTGAILTLLNPRKGDVAIAAVFGVVAFVGLLLLVVARAVMRRTQPMQPRAPSPISVSSHVGQFLVDTPEIRESDGRRYEVHYLKPIPGKNGRPSSLHIRVDAPTPTTLQFHPENWFDRFSKSIGIAREHHSGDDEFDREVYVRCPSEAYAELILADADRRSAVLALRKLGFHNVQLDGSQAVAHWPQFDPAKHDHPELVSATADLLAVLAKDLPAEDPDDAANRIDRRRGWLVFLWFAVILYAITIVSLGFCPPIHTSELMLTALPTFIGGYIAFGWIAAFLIGGTSTSHDKWGVLMVFALLFHGLGSVGTTAAINGLGDPGPLVQHDLVIVDKRTHTSSGKSKKTSYYAKVASWEPAGGTLEFKVGSGEYSQIVPGRSKLHLVVGSGRMGFEWLKSQHVVP